jgi:two-component system, cell cycle response regulator
MIFEDDLKSFYLDSLASHVTALEAAMRGLELRESEAAGSVRRIAHTLAGSGGTYGFPAISRAAKLLEEAPTEVLAAHLHNLLKVLKKVRAEGAAAQTLILIVDDDPLMTEMLRAKLTTPGRVVLTAETAGEAQEILNAKDVDLIILDLILPDADGRGLLLRLKENAATAAIPIIIATSRDGEQTRIECLALGADDYIQKPASPDLVLAIVGRVLRRTAESAAEAGRDYLTGLPDRAAFHEYFQKMQAQSPAPGRPFSLAMIDLDGFKEINDSCGHPAGDGLLRSVARRFSSSLRAADLLARWGGDEFILLMPDSDRIKSVRALEAVLGLLRRHPFPLPGGRQARIGFSAGVVEVGGPTTLARVIEEADGLLYRAKAAGGGRIFPEESPSRPSRTRILVVDGDKASAADLSCLLEGEGFETLACGDGDGAVREASAFQASLVLADADLASRNGFNLLDRLREVPGYGRVPLVLCAAHCSPEAVARGLEAGADDVIAKPCHPLELPARIRCLLRRVR